MEPIKKYNYFYDNLPITKTQFIRNVPEHWESDVIDGEYSYGYYMAIEIEQ